MHSCVTIAAINVADRIRFFSLLSLIAISSLLSSISVFNQFHMTYHRQKTSPPAGIFRNESSKISVCCSLRHGSSGSKCKAMSPYTPFIAIFIAVFLLPFKLSCTRCKKSTQDVNFSFFRKGTIKKRAAAQQKYLLMRQPRSPNSRNLPSL